MFKFNLYGKPKASNRKEEETTKSSLLVQANLNTAKLASVVLANKFVKLHLKLALIQEFCSVKDLKKRTKR